MNKNYLLKLVLICGLFILCKPYLKAENQIEKIHRYLENCKTDSCEIKHTYNLILYYRSHELDSLQKYLKVLKHLGIKNNDYNAIFKAMLIEGHNFDDLNQYKSADSIYSEMEKMKDKVDSGIFLYLYSGYSTQAYQKKNYKKCIKYSDKSINLLKIDSTENYHKIATIYINKGQAFSRLDNFDEALENYKMALHYIEKSNFEVEINKAWVYEKIAILYKNFDNDHFADKNYRVALTNAKMFPNKYFPILQNYLNLKYSQDSLKYFSHEIDSLIANTKYLKMRNMPFYYTILTNYYIETDQIEYAKFSNDSLLETCRKINHNDRLSDYYKNLGDIYFIEKDYLSAKTNYQYVLDSFELKERLETALIKSLISANLLNDGKIKEEKLLNKFSENLLIRQSAFVDEEIGKWRVAYEDEIKTLELDKIKAENLVNVLTSNKRKNWLLGSILFIIMMLGIISRLFYSRKKIQSQSKDLLLANANISTLHKELNHRVKNNLAFMTSLLEMQGRRTDSSEAKEIIKDSEGRMKALSLVHAHLYKKDVSTTINLTQYLEEIARNLEQVFSKPDKLISIETSIKVIDVDAEIAMRIGLILNELVTNSAKHAFENQHNPIIKIESYVADDGKINLRYEDGGKTITNDAAKKNPYSMGLKLIQLLRAQLDKEVSFHIV
jgi:two-component sensor histidine kinase